MACERYLNSIHESIDGTIGSIRRAELENAIFFHQFAGQSAGAQMRRRPA